jgi:transglutaminase-like putative cysteine protease
MSRSTYENIPYETNGTSWILIPGKTNTGTINISSYLDGGRGLLALPAGCGQLDHLPAFILQKNALGTVFAEGPGLVIFDASHGPGATIDSEPSLPDDTFVHPGEIAAVDEVIKQLDLKSRPPAAVLRGLREFFANEFTYSAWHELGQPGDATNTPVARFLLHDRRGHCEYFATATALLLRRLQIPARYAVGYAVHDGANGKYVVRERDGHAWCLVWDAASRTWQDFDTTPASWQAEEKKLGAAFQWLSDAWSRLVFEFSKLRWGQTNLRKYILIGVVPVLLLLLYQILFRRRKRKPPGAASLSVNSWPGLDSELYELEKRLKKRGRTRPPGEPVAAWLQRVVQDEGFEDARKALAELVLLHYRYRFDPEGLNPEERTALRERAAKCVRQLSR